MVQSGVHDFNHTAATSENRCMLCNLHLRGQLNEIVSATAQQFDRGIKSVLSVAKFNDVSFVYGGAFFLVDWFFYKSNSVRCTANTQI